MAYQKQIRRVAIFRTLARFRQQGENPYIRALYDSRMIMNYAFSFKMKRIKQKSQQIMIEILSQAGNLISLEKRLEIYTFNGKKHE